MMTLPLLTLDNVTASGAGGRKMGGRNWAFALPAGAIALAVAATAAAQTPSYIFTTIDVPRASLTAARGINDAGQIVGSFTDNAGTHGFVLSGGSFTQIDVPGASSTHGGKINTKGQIVGRFTDSAGTHGFFLRQSMSRRQTPASAHSPRASTTPIRSSAISS
jgi:probable HAF family extracellular repeat protein